MQAREAGTRLSAAYGRLSEPQRRAFELVKGSGVSQAQAASLLGTTVTGIKLRVHRAYLALRAAVAEGGEGDGTHGSAAMETSARATESACQSRPRRQRQQSGSSAAIGGRQ